VLRVPGHGAREHLGLHVPAGLGEAFRRERVIDPDHVLLDDRPLVKVRCHVVGGGADQLDAPGVGLVIRLGALEARQERVVDVDHPALDPLAYLRRQDLHVPGQHDQLRLVGVDQAEQRGFGVRLGGRGDREVVERQPVRRGQRPEVRVVRHDAGDVDRQRAALPAEQQVVQAMPEPGHHDQGPHLSRRVVQPPGHVERLRYPGEVTLQLLDFEARRRHGELHPHEEPSVGPRVGRLLAVLLAGHDVGRMLDQEAGHRVHDARLIRAGQRQYVRHGHASPPARGAAAARSRPARPGCRRPAAAA
jgi:hypothetical protein